MTDTRRPGSRGRVARRVAVVAGGTLVAIGGVLGYLQTESGNEWLRGRIEARLNERMDGSAKLGLLRWSLLRGARVERVSLRDRAGAEVVGIQEVTVEPTLRLLARGQIGLSETVVRGVRLNLVQAEDGTTNLSRLFPPRPASSEPSDPNKKKREIHLASVRIEDVGATVLQRNGVKVTLAGASLSAHVDARPSERDLSAAVTARDLGVTLHWPSGQEVNLAGLGTGIEAKLVGGAGDLTLGPLAATLGGVSAEGRRFEPAPIALGKLSVHLEKGQVTAAVEQLELLALAVGSVEARMGLGENGPDYTGQGSLGGVKPMAARSR